MSTLRGHLALARMSQYLAGVYHLELRGAEYRSAYLFFFVFFAVSGVPVLGWNNIAWGDVVLLVGFELTHYFLLGITKQRVEWFICWSREVAFFFF